MLLTAVHAKISGTELALVAVLVNVPDYKIKQVSDLWGGDSRWRKPTAAEQILPYTRQGIDKALKKLEARGWGERYGGYGYGKTDPAFRLLPISILSEAPKTLQVGQPQLQSPGECNVRSKVPADVQAGLQQFTSSSSRSGELIVKVTKHRNRLPSGKPGTMQWRCRAEGGKGPDAYYAQSAYSKSEVALVYAAKCLTRLHDDDVDPSDLEKHALGRGRFSFVVKDSAPLKIAREQKTRAVKKKSAKERERWYIRCKQKKNGTWTARFDAMDGLFDLKAEHGSAATAARVLMEKASKLGKVPAPLPDLVISLQGSNGTRDKTYQARVRGTPKRPKGGAK